MQHFDMFSVPVLYEANMAVYLHEVSFVVIALHKFISCVISIFGINVRD